MATHKIVNDVLVKLFSKKSLTQKKSTKKLKASFLVYMFLLSLFVVSFSCAPIVCAVEKTVNEKSRVVSNDVIGLKLNQYEIQLTEYKQDLYLDVLPQENMRYTLKTNQSTLDLYYTFVNGNLQKIHVLDNQGSPHMKRSEAVNSVENAKDFLFNFQEYSKNNFYNKLGSMLTEVDVNKNLTVTFENTKLSVTYQKNSATFKWMYTINGIEAPEKSVTLHYENGFLKYFIDNWDLYKIGSTTIKISEQEAIDIAMARASGYSWSMPVDDKVVDGLKYNVTNAMIWETVFANSLFMNNPRDPDRLMLFPMRHVWVSFDKYYPGNVYGMNVYVWADTGEIGHIQERYTTQDPTPDLIDKLDDLIHDVESNDVTTQSNKLSILWILFPAIVALILGSAKTCFGRNKKLNSLTFPKYASKINGLLLCLLLTSTLVIFATSSAVSGLPQYGRAAIWGSESTGANYPVEEGGYGFSWRKHPNEVAQQQSTAAFIQSKFQQNGYNATDNQGSKGSDKTSILTQIQTMEQGYPRVAVIDFDHGNGSNETQIDGAPADEFHYLFEDNNGTRVGPTNMSFTKATENGVYDTEIFQNTALGRYFFVFINTCNSAHVNATFYVEDLISEQGNISGTNRIRGMPYAWTHRLVKSTSMPGFTTDEHMSDDGYASADNGDFVYLGFDFGSAALNQSVTGSLGPKPYWYWFEHFFSYALTNNWSVKQALDEASQQFYGCDFGQAPLHTGYNSTWPEYRLNKTTGLPFWDNDTGPDSKLVVYGNGNIKLYQPLLSLSATGGLSPTFYVDGQSHSVGSYRKISDIYSIDVSDVPGYTFSHFSSGQTSYGRPANIQIAFDRQITAHYTQQGQCSLTISAGTGGSTNPSPGTYWYNQSTSVQVTANPSQDYYFDQWLLDGEFYSRNPTVNVTMDTSHNLQASFVYGSYGLLRMIIDGNGTTVPAEGDTYISTGALVQLNATADEGWHFVRWVIYGQSIYDNPYSFNMPLELLVILAEFETDIPYYPVLVRAMDIVRYQEIQGIPVYVDSEYIGDTIQMPSLPEGNHTIEVPYKSGGYQFMGWYCSKPATYNHTAVTVDVDSYTVLFALYQ